MFFMSKAGQFMLQVYLHQVQCTMILLGQAKPLQMFLPFMYNMKTSETLFDKVSNGKVKLLQG